jgi:hypothetical protein
MQQSSSPAPQTSVVTAAPGRAIRYGQGYVRNPGEFSLDVPEV